jgi:hypothetical protein
MRRTSAAEIDMAAESAAARLGGSAEDRVRTRTRQHDVRQPVHVAVRCTGRPHTLASNFREASRAPIRD